MTSQYDLQAHRITEVFAAQRIPARVWQVTVSPQFATFRCTFALSTRLNKVQALDKELKVALGVPFVRIAEADGAVNIEVPRAGASRLITLPDVLARLTRAPAHTAVLGIDGANVPLLLRIDSPDVAHILISGTTGSGKTVLLRTLLLSLAMLNRPGQLQIALIDPKKRLAALARLPHLWRQIGLISEPADAALLLAALVAEMQTRDRLGRSTPRLVIALDELADLLQAGGDSIADPLQRLTQRGREAGLHVIAATQRPAATLVGGLVKANFPVRLIGSVTSVDDAKVAAGIGGTGAERLLGRGDFLVVAKGQVLRFQVADLAEHTVPGLVAAAGSGQGRRQRAWSEADLNRAVRGETPDRPWQGRAPVELRVALADLLPAPDPVREGRALVPLTLTPGESLPADNAGQGASAVHQGAPVPAPLIAPAPPAAAAQRGALPRRPDGPTAEDRALLRQAYARLGSLNKTVAWAYGSKGTLTAHWVKLALRQEPSLLKGDVA